MKLRLAASLAAKNLPLRSVLRMILRDLDLTYVVKDGTMRITTVQSAEENPMKRIYFLEGTGLHPRDNDTIINLIYSTVSPDTWDVGGSEFAPLKSPDHDRPGIVVTTAYYKHEQIADLLATLRQSQVGRDPGN